MQGAALVPGYLSALRGNRRSDRFIIGDIWTSSRRFTSVFFPPLLRGALTQHICSLSSVLKNDPLIKTLTLFQSMKATYSAVRSIILLRTIIAVNNMPFLGISGLLKQFYLRSSRAGGQFYLRTVSTTELLFDLVLLQLYYTVTVAAGADRRRTLSRGGQCSE